MLSFKEGGFMSSDFIQIKSLAGEMKLYHKRKELAATVSTQEFVLQKPHVNYHIRLEDIISIVPFQPNRTKRVPFVNERTSGNEVTYLTAHQAQYRFSVRKATMHNRSGIFQMGPSDFIIPVLDELLQAIAEYGGMKGI
jgi:hypothetical protein